MNLHVLVWSMVLAVVAAGILYYAIYAPKSPVALPKEQPATSTPAPDAVPAPEKAASPPASPTNP